MLQVSTARNGLLCGLALVAATALAAAQNNGHDDLKGRWINYEVGTMNAFAFSTESSEVFSFNQPGARIFDFSSGAPMVRGEVPVGPGTVAIELRPGTHELWIVDRVTATVSVLDTQTGLLEQTIQLGAEPHMIVFTEDGERAYVSCSVEGTVDVIDTALYLVSQSIEIPARAPRGLAIVGDHVYVTPLLSGNGSSPRGSSLSGLANDVVDVHFPGLDAGTRALPDSDLFAIQITADPTADWLDPAFTTSGLGTVLFAARARPGSSEVWIPNTEALNVPFQGEKSFFAGQVAQNRVAVIDTNKLGGGTNSDAVSFINLDALIPVDLRCSTPTDVAFTSDGAMAFVCGYGSDAIAVFSVSGSQASWLGSIRVQPRTGYPDGAGPRTLSVSPDDQYLFIHNKGENGMARVELALLPTSAGFAYDTLPNQSFAIGWDPLPLDINQGRVHFNRTQNSLSNTSSCMTCHVDGHIDGVAWDLSGYLDPEGLPPGMLDFPVDNKGPLVTQSVRRLKEIGPYHWRGEKKELLDFNGTFIDLMEREEEGESKDLGVNFRYITQYMETLMIPPNPRQQPGRGLTSDQAAGRNLFMNRMVQGSLTCDACHTLPLGTRGEIVNNHSNGLAPTGVVPALREVTDKTSPEYFIGGNYGTRTEAGIGYGHHGAYATLESFLVTHAQDPGAGGGVDLTHDEALKLAEFLRAYDTGSAPAAARQHTATALNAQTFYNEHLGAMQFQAQVGNCDLVYRYGPILWNGLTTYMTGLYDPVADDYIQASAWLPRLSSNDLINLAAGGQPVTFLGVPPFMGLPMGLDRDNDKYFDLDEYLASTDSENGDTDEDGYHDGYELKWQMNPLVPDSTSPDQVAPSLVGNVEVVYLTTNAVKLEFHTDEPVRALFSYNGGPIVLRAPLFPKQDVDFSIVLSKLEVDTDYDIELWLTDLAGNVALPHVAVRTLPFSLPTPAHVSDLDLTLIQDRSGSGFADLMARITMELSAGVPAVGYDAHVTAYYKSDDESQYVDLGSFNKLTGPAGKCGFRVSVPSTVTPGQGKLYFVVERVEAPANMPVYAEGDDAEMFGSIDY